MEEMLSELKNGDYENVSMKWIEWTMVGHSLVSIKK